MDFVLCSAFKDKVDAKNHGKENQFQKEVEMVYEDLDDNFGLCETKQKQEISKRIKKIILQLHFQLKLFVHSYGNNTLL
jgi:hypothetical protein